MNHPVFARFYPRLAAAAERSGTGDYRRRLLAEASGRVIEIGAGPGGNFAHYPAAVEQVLAVEPEGHMRALAEQAAETAPVPVSVVDGVAERLPAADGEFDSAVFSLVLCTVPDPTAALREVHRVLRPGGRLFFWEHVRSQAFGFARVQNLLDRTVWPFFGGGCHVGRDTGAAIARAGFTIERLQRFHLPDTRIPLPMAPQILGVACRG